MNQKTARLLRKYSEIKEDKEEKELKRWWNSLNHTERGEERKRILAEIEADKANETSEAE